MTMGMNALPESPKRRKILSRMKAIRAMYPESSRMEKNRKRVRICGMNPSTANTPPRTPSTTKLPTHGAAFAHAMSASTLIHSSTQFRRFVRMTPGENTAPS